MFYLKLASQNIRKSFAIFAPFVLASLVLYSLLCSMFLLILSPVMEHMGTGGVTLSLGVIVLTIFSLIMEIYSFNFLMKQRSKEFGLYNMLGMNKRKVSLIASLELLMIFILVALLGSALAAVFSNLMYLIFVNLTNFSELNFTISPLAFLLNSVIFTGIFFVLELLAIRTIRKTSPLILFRASEKGEKEPKGNILLAFIGLLGLGTGYYLSLSSSGVGAIAVIFRFFFAVLCVIVGTYLFYISFMTWYLKKRRQNKTYFYKPEHFITTSQMIFRMKQHATGLANITLLAVMAFVTIATTSSLHTGMTQNLDQLYPRETSISIYSPDREQGQAFLQETVLSKFPEKADNLLTYLTYQAGLSYDNGDEIAITKENLANFDYSDVYYTYFITQDDFRALGNDLNQLGTNQVAFMRPENKPSLKTLRLGEQVFEVAANLDKAVFPDIINTLNPAILIVPDEQTLLAFRDFYTTNGENTGMLQTITYRAFLDLTDEEVASLGTNGGDEIGLSLEDSDNYGNIMQKQVFNNMLYGFTGGFLFTGFLLGISFLLGAALIIYYKQYSEGHEDKKSYKILQEVGMSQQAIRKNINSQVLLVFFMPLGMATLHFVIALVMLKQLLLMFGITSSSLIYTISGGTIVAVCLLYYLIYKWTSRTYYRIINRKLT